MRFDSMDWIIGSNSVNENIITHLVNHGTVTYRVVSLQESLNVPLFNIDISLFDKSLQSKSLLLMVCYILTDGIRASILLPDHMKQI